MSIKNKIAIVSGKGGSGKTMISATLAKILDSQSKTVLLVDTDSGTGGLTYYLGISEVENIGVGLGNILKRDKSELEEPDFPSSQIKKVRSLQNTFLLGIGDQKILNSSDSATKKSLYSLIISSLDYRSKYSFDFVIFDCRGGVDQDTIDVCGEVDKIIMVVETDTTSFQATHHMVEALRENDLEGKVAGFFVNKVFDDPSVFVRTASPTFKSQFLSAIPFDFDAIRSFLVGDLPDSKTFFYRQNEIGLYKVFSEEFSTRVGDGLRFQDFNGLSLRDDYSIGGGIIFSFLGLSLFSFALMSYLFIEDRLYNLTITSLLALVSVLSGFEPIRRASGRIVNVFFQSIVRLFGGK